MNYPKCGAKNPENDHLCGSCSTSLIRAKTSKLAIVSLVLGILSLFLFILTGIRAIVAGIISLLKIRRSDGALKGKYIALVGMNVSIVFMCIFYILWSRDAPPIPNDYTLADLRSAPAECAESFEILRTLIDEDHNIPGAPAIGLSDGDIDMIEEIMDVLEEGTEEEIVQILNYDANDIKAAWANSQKARDIIRRLNEFTEIADLTQPNLNFESMRWRNLIDLARLYQVYAHLHVGEKDIHTFGVELIKLDSMLRKLSLNVRQFVPRLSCCICLETDLKTANAIINNPNTSGRTIDLIAKQFIPLTMEQLSIRNSVLFGYLLNKDLIINALKADRSVKTRHLKTHSTLRVFRNLYDDWLSVIEKNSHVTTRFSAWPDHYPFEEPDPLSTQWSLPLIYKFYNPVGSKLIRMDKLSIKIDFKERFTLPFRANLLQVVLNRKLGKEVGSKVRADSDEYIVDIENKKIFSPGPDGKSGTKDDIKLRINPKVLGWGD